LNINQRFRLFFLRFCSAFQPW